jgi:hypothetical protein
LASPVEWVLGLPLGFLNSAKPQVTQEGHRATQGPVWLGHGVTPGCRLAQADSFAFAILITVL